MSNMLRLNFGEDEAPFQLHGLEFGSQGARVEIG